jgi:hypothetical protein
MSNPPTTPEPEPTSQAPPDVPRGLQLTDIDLKRRESQTARHVTITLLVMLGGTVVLQFATLIVLTITNRLDAASHFDQMFAVWIPLLSGLVGSAVTFYLTREKK